MAEKENIKDKLENLKEGHRKSNKDIIESLFAILGYLKKIQMWTIPQVRRKCARWRK